MVWGLGALALPLGAQPPSAGLDVRETLSGILAYTRWPKESDPLRLCVTGSSPHAEQLLQNGLSRPGKPLTVVQRVQPDAKIADVCDALYVGELEADAWRELLPGLAGRAVLTICERSEACASGGMVRLDIDEKSQHVRFEVNLDAVARSTVRIHPQVLRLGRRPSIKAAP